MSWSFVVVLVALNLLPSLLFGFVAGLRTFLPLAVVSWGARTGFPFVSGTPLAFMGYKYTPIILAALAIFELVLDKLPSTGSRKAPGPFIGRVISGALCGATIGSAWPYLLLPGLALGAVGAVAGTLGGSAFRAKLAAAFGRDLPAAIVEDLVAIVIAVGSILLLR